MQELAEKNKKLIIIKSYFGLIYQKLFKKNAPDSIFPNSNDLFQFNSSLFKIFFRFFKNDVKNNILNSFIIIIINRIIRELIIENKYPEENIIIKLINLIKEKNDYEDYKFLFLTTLGLIRDPDFATLFKLIYFYFEKNKINDINLLRVILHTIIELENIYPQKYKKEENEKKILTILNKINDLFKIVNEKEITIKIFIEQLEKGKNEPKEKNSIKFEEIIPKKEVETKTIKKTIEKKDINEENLQKRVKMPKSSENQEKNDKKDGSPRNEEIMEKEKGQKIAKNEKNVEKGEKINEKKNLTNATKKTQKKEIKNNIISEIKNDFQYINNNKCEENVITQNIIDNKTDLKIKKNDLNNKSNINLINKEEIALNKNVDSINEKKENDSINIIDNKAQNYIDELKKEIQKINERQKQNFEKLNEELTIEKKYREELKRKYDKLNEELTIEKKYKEEIKRKYDKLNEELTIEKKYREEIKRKYDKLNEELTIEKEKSSVQDEKIIKLNEKLRALEKGNDNLKQKIQKNKDSVNEKYKNMISLNQRLKSQVESNNSMINNSFVNLNKIKILEEKLNNIQMRDLCKGIINHNLSLLNLPREGKYEERIKKIMDCLKENKNANIYIKFLAQISNFINQGNHLAHSFERKVIIGEMPEKLSDILLRNININNSLNGYEIKKIKIILDKIKIDETLELLIDTYEPKKIIYDKVVKCDVNIFDN